MNLSHTPILNFVGDELLAQADRDYIAARTLYMTGLGSQFLWSAQQALEKVSKSILLFHGKDVREIGHNLTRCRRKAPCFSNGDIRRPS